ATPGGAPRLDLPLASASAGGVYAQLNSDIIAAPQHLGQFIFLSGYGLPILDIAFRPNPAETRGGPGVIKRLRRADQVLRRHTAGVDAGAADRPVPDERNAGTEFGGGDGCREAGRPGPNDREVVSRLIVPCVTSSRRPL